MRILNAIRERVAEALSFCRQHPCAETHAGRQGQRAQELVPRGLPLGRDADAELEEGDPEHGEARKGGEVERRVDRARPPGGEG